MILGLDVTDFFMAFQFFSGSFAHCTEMRFASFLSGGFITAITVNPPERKLAKRTSVDWSRCCTIF